MQSASTPAGSLCGVLTPKGACTQAVTVYLAESRMHAAWGFPLQPPQVFHTSAQQGPDGVVSKAEHGRATPCVLTICASCRVCRRRLRAHLLRRCAAGGVRFRAGELVRLEPNEAGDTATLALADGSIVRTRYTPCSCKFHGEGLTVRLAFRRGTAASLGEECSIAGNDSNLSDAHVCPVGTHTSGIWLLHMSCRLPAPAV